MASKGVSDVSNWFNDLHKLFTYIHLTPIYRKRAWVILDGGKAGTDEISKLKIGFKDLSENFKCFSKHDFEEYYPKIYSSDIALIKSEIDPKKKGILKVDLAKKIVSDYENRNEGLIKMFEESSKEVIEKLREIETFFKKVKA